MLVELVKRGEQVSGVSKKNVEGLALLVRRGEGVSGVSKKRVSW